MAIMVPSSGPPLLSASSAWRWLLQLSLFFGTALLGVSAQQFSISINSTCVLPSTSQSLGTEYQIRGDDNRDSWYWVGIYQDWAVHRLNSRFAVIDGEPELWVWSCGDQACAGNLRSGSITFGSDRPGAWLDSAWPLGPGQHRAVLVNFVEEEPEPEEYVAVAYSDPFQVSTECVPETTVPNDIPGNNGDDNMIDNDIPSNNLQPNNSPTNPPTNSPTNPPTSTPTRGPPPMPLPNDMSSVIENARADITSVIQNRRVLSALYLRMIFHDCVGGGCDGCINTLNQDNGGLNSAMNSLMDLEAKYRFQGLSRADLWVLASYVAVDMALPRANENNTAHLIPFRHYGRKNCASSNLRRGPDPPLCSPDFGTNEIVDYFQEHFNFTTRETAAIMGAHTIGVARRGILGFAGENGWVPDNTVFDNAYYEELVGVNTDPVEGAPQWRMNMVNNTNLTTGNPNDPIPLPHRFQWEGFPGGRKVMMLNSDIAMVRQLDDTNKHNNTGEVFCKFVSRGPPETVPRCPAARLDLFNPMVDYAHDNELFLNDFRDAMIKMTDTGYRVGPCDSDGICRLIQ